LLPIKSSPRTLRSNTARTVQEPTVPVSFVKSMLTGAQKSLPPQAVDKLATGAGISPSLLVQQDARVTREQFVRFYEALSLATGDEMLGLWSRPIRAGSLKYIGLSLLDAPSLMVAVYRFTRFWNLLLDDYALKLTRNAGIATISLQPLTLASTPVPFGHQLMVKLTHGVVSWLAGARLAVHAVGFGFSRPADFDEYAQFFPGPIAFGQERTWIAFEEKLLRQPFQRSRAQLLDFVRRAPDDWIFVTFDHGVVTSQVQSYLSEHFGKRDKLEDAASALHLSDRSLSRRLADEATTFRKLRDEAKRDFAVDRLVKTRQSIDQIAAAAGFENTSAFHRAFKSWTGSTPGDYRQQSKL
jgi:AraC-like DNA-binding protein